MDGRSFVRDPVYGGFWGAPGDLVVLYRNSTQRSYLPVGKRCPGPYLRSVLSGIGFRVLHIVSVLVLSVEVWGVGNKKGDLVVSESSGPHGNCGPRLSVRVPLQKKGTFPSERDQEHGCRGWGLFSLKCDRLCRRRRTGRSKDWLKCLLPLVTRWEIVGARVVVYW